MAYYVMIHFGDNKSAVTGFLVPEATDETDAIRQVKSSLIYAKNVNSKTGGDLSAGRCKEFLSSLKKPWKINKDREAWVRVVKTNKPLMAGFWLQEIDNTKTLCNTVEWRC